MNHTSWPNSRNLQLTDFVFRSSLKINRSIKTSAFYSIQITGSSLTGQITGTYKQFLDYSTINFQRPIACKACSFFFFCRCGKSHSEIARKLLGLPKLDRPIKAPDPIRVGWKCQTRHFEMTGMILTRDNDTKNI